MTRRVRVNRTETEWRELFERFRASGLTRKKFIEREGVSRSAFEKHLRRQKPAEGRTWQRRPEFVPIGKGDVSLPAVQTEDARQVYAVELVLSSGTIVRVRG